MKLALVTGGCRRIGAAIAARLARDGHALALHAGHDAEPDTRPPRHAGGDGRGSRVFAADLADSVATETLVARVADHFGRAPDVLVNSAARFAFDKPETVTMGAMLDHHAVNVAAPAILARTLAEAIGQAGEAVIVNILDQRIAQPHGDQLSYTLSKLALADLTRILARHYAPRLRVAGVAPGLTLPTGEYAPGQMEAPRRGDAARPPAPAGGDRRRRRLSRLRPLRDGAGAVRRWRRASAGL